MVWVQDLIREQREIFGADPWPYNLEDNRKTLEAVIRYEFEQGMIKKKPNVEELFFPAEPATNPALRLVGLFRVVSVRKVEFFIGRVFDSSAYQLPNVDS